MAIGIGILRQWFLPRIVGTVWWWRMIPFLSDIHSIRLALSCMISLIPIIVLIAILRLRLSGIMGIILLTVLHSWIVRRWRLWGEGSHRTTRMAWLYRLHGTYRGSIIVLTLSVRIDRLLLTIDTAR